MRTVLIFDLDDTLILQDKMTVETVRYCTAFLGLDADIFWSTFQKTSREAFESLPCADWCRMVGISAQEGLWGNFGGAPPALNQLRRALADYRYEAWHRALDEHGFPDPALARSIAADFAELRYEDTMPFPRPVRCSPPWRVNSTSPSSPTVPLNCSGARFTVRDSRTCSRA